MTSLLRSTTTARGRANAAWTALTAAAGVRPPTLTPATRTPAGIVGGGPAFGVVVVTAVVVAAVVIGTVVTAPVVVADVEVVMSAITVPESVPATPSPSRNRAIAARRFTVRAV